MQLLGRLTFPISMLAFPFYLLNRSPGKEGSHYDPKTDMFKELEAPMVRTPRADSAMDFCMVGRIQHGPCNYVAATREVLFITSLKFRNVTQTCCASFHFPAFLGVLSHSHSVWPGHALPFQTPK